MSRHDRDPAAPGGAVRFKIDHDSDAAAESRVHSAADGDRDGSSDNNNSKETKTGAKVAGGKGASRSADVGYKYGLQYYSGAKRLDKTKVQQWASDLATKAHDAITSKQLLQEINDLEMQLRDGPTDKPNRKKRRARLSQQSLDHNTNMHEVFGHEKPGRLKELADQGLLSTAGSWGRAT